MQSNVLNAVYMDNHATTRVDPRVVEAMRPYFSEVFGNPGSAHVFGEAAREAVESSRERIAAAIGAAAEEIVFTSGATESNSLAIRGVAERVRRRGNHLVSVITEHSAVLDPIARLSKRGYESTLLDVAPHGASRAGWIDPERVAEAIRDDTVLVSVMLANNEIGVIAPVREIGAICRERGVLLHSDATQGVGRIPVDVDDLNVDLMSFTAHKIYGPKGVGALYIRGGRPSVRIDAQITGGGQQEGRRSGTLNVPGIVGLAAAMELCLAEMEDEGPRLAKLRDQLAAEIRAQVDGADVVGPGLTETDSNGRPLRLPGNLGMTFAGLDGGAMMLQMPELAVSSGATCASADAKPSHVLRALGLSDDQARSSLRFGLGRFNTAEDIDSAARSVSAAAARLRAI